MSHIPPATRDGWSYSGDFHVEASGNNRHRRATLPELKAVFDGSDGAKDRPAHWYEAQLLHYGLPPSKTKGTAKMRLFDAVSKGNMAVPAHILKVESELKKDWAKRDREAKQLVKKSSTSVVTTAAKGSNKRKADNSAAGAGPGTNVNISLNVSLGPQGNFQVTPVGPAAKKAKISKPKPSEATPKPKGRPASTAPASKATKAPAKPKENKPLTAERGHTKQTARRGTSSTRGVKSATSRTSSATSNDKQVSRGSRLARCSRPYNRAAPGRSTAPTERPAQFDTTPSQWYLDSPDEPPPPYPGSPKYSGGGYTDSEGRMYSDDDHYSEDSSDSANSYNSSSSLSSSHRAPAPAPSSAPLPPLGLLNGRYALRCTAPPDFADHDHSAHSSGLILTLDGDSLWGSFEIGPLSGVLRLDERPWQASARREYFAWCGDDNQGGRHAERDDGSYLVFLGGGRVEGDIGFYGDRLRFEGCRVSGRETRSEVSAGEMRALWGRLWEG